MSEGRTPPREPRPSMSVGEAMESWLPFMAETGSVDMDRINEGLGVMQHIMESVSRADSPEMVELKRHFLRFIERHDRTRIDHPTLLRLLNGVEMVTRKGHDTALASELFEALLELLDSNRFSGGEDLAPACFRLGHVAMSCAKKPGVEAMLGAIRFVWCTWDSCWERGVGEAVLRDGILIIQSVCPSLPVEAVPDDVLRCCCAVLCLGMTVPGVMLEGEAPPVDDHPQLVFPPGSVAAVARDTLHMLLGRATFSVLFSLRWFLHEPHALQHKLLRQRHDRNMSHTKYTVPLTGMGRKHVATLRGAINALRFLCFWKEEGLANPHTALAPKESMVVLGSLRYSLASRDVKVCYDILLFLNRLVSGIVAPHLEAHWRAALDILHDVTLIFHTQLSEIGWVWRLYQAILRELFTLHSRMELETDRMTVMALLDRYVFSMRKEDSGTPDTPFIGEVFEKRLGMERENPQMITTLMSRALSDEVDIEVQRDCIRRLRKKIELDRDAYYVQQGVVTIIRDEAHRSGYFDPSRWAMQVVWDMVGLLVDCLKTPLDPERTEMLFVKEAYWDGVVELCRDVVLHCSRDEMQWEVLKALRDAGVEKMRCGATGHCDIIWGCMLSLLKHPAPRVRVFVLDYFSMFTCTPQFEVRFMDISHGREDRLKMRSVAKEPTSPLEIEFPVAGLIDAIAQRIHDTNADCFFKAFELLRSLLLNNFFICGNTRSTAPALRQVVVELSHFTREEGWQALSRLPTTLSPLPAVVSTVTLLFPYCRIIPGGGEKSSIATLIDFCSFVLKKTVVSRSLFTSTPLARPAAPSAHYTILIDVFQAMQQTVLGCMSSEALSLSATLKESTRALLRELAESLPQLMDLVEFVKQEPRPPQPPEQPAMSLPPSPAARPHTPDGGGPPPSTPETPGVPPAFPPPPSSTSSHCPSPTPTPTAPSAPPMPMEGPTTTARKCLLSLLTLIHSFAAWCPLLDERAPISADLPQKERLAFISAVFAFIIHLLDPNKADHRLHLLSHAIAGETLVRCGYTCRQIIISGGGSEPSNLGLLKKLLEILHPAKASQTHPPRAKFVKRHETPSEHDPTSPLSRTASARADQMRTRGGTTTVTPVAADHFELVRGLIDLAWKAFFLGSCEAVPHWDPLTEAMFADGQTSCWIVHVPHAPVLVTTTVGRSQHMLVTYRTVTGVSCWTVILHNKPSLPLFLDRQSSRPDFLPKEPEAVMERSSSTSIAAPVVELPVITPSALLVDHEEEMRGLLDPPPSEGSSRSTSPNPKPSSKRRSLSPTSDLGDNPPPPYPTFAPVAPPMVHTGSDMHLPHAGSDDLPRDEDGRESFAGTNSPPLTIPAVDWRDGNTTSTIHGSFLFSLFKVSPPPTRLRSEDSQLLRSLGALDKLPSKETHKVGVLYIDKNQYVYTDWTEREKRVLGNTGGSKRYQLMLCDLGRFKDLKIPTEDPRESVRRGCWPQPCYYFGALDTVRHEDGDLCLISETDLNLVVYHVATIMPSPLPDKKKRHIGNDNVIITYAEDSDTGISPFVLRNELNYIGILVQPLSPPFSRVSVHVRQFSAEKEKTELQSLLDEPGFGPVLNDKNGIIVHDTQISVFLSQAALHASLASKSLRFSLHQYSSSWGDRLHRLQQLESRFAVRPEHTLPEDTLLSFADLVGK